jgi:cytochrome P450
LAATNAVWLLSQHPGLERQVIEAVSQLPPDFVDDDLKQIKILQNIINETLRLRGSVTQALLRGVPAGGAEFCGYFVPEGITCGIQSHTMHRDPAVW